jgi:2,3-bisphosphoglycerate-independent phosphoglycerate mutase
MKHILVSFSGGADQPAEELGGKTPLESAKMPNLHALTKAGKLGVVKLHADRHEPSGDTAFLNLLGYDADKVFTGRGPLEAANLELKLEENEIPFRMNFITEYSGRLTDATAGRIGTKEAKALINFLNKKLASDFVRFFAGSGHRHVAVLKDSHGFEALSARTASPDSILDERMENHFPKGPGEELLKKLMFDARLLLQDHEINQVRIDLAENPANMIWLWGQGQRPQLEKFSERTGLSAALVSAIEYARGVGRLAGLTVLEGAERAAEVESAYDKIGRLLVDILSEKDTAVCHVDECDEAGLAGDLKSKISALESFDFFIASRVKEYLEKNEQTRVLICPLQATPWKARRHVREVVPFVLAGSGVDPDGADRFGETAARVSEFKVGKGSELMSLFLGGRA